MVEEVGLPGIVKKEVKENDSPKVETLLVFGQGPVVDKNTRDKPDERTKKGAEDINFWSKNLANAAAFLFKKNAMRKFAVLGGRTGGERFASEAELIKKEMVNDGVSEDGVETENISTDTVRNIVNYLNSHESPGQEVDEVTYSILATKYHLPRVRLLMKLFRLPVKNCFTSEDVLRYKAMTGEGDSPSADAFKWNEKLLNTLDAETQMDDNSFYSSRIGTERRPFSDRFIKEAVWIREIMERPEIFLQYINRIKNDKRAEAILDNTEKLWPGLLRDKYGIDRKGQNITSIKEILGKIKYESISADVVSKWEGETRAGWRPPEVKKRLELLDQL